VTWRELRHPGRASDTTALRDLTRPSRAELWKILMKPIQEPDGVRKRAREGVALPVRDMTLTRYGSETVVLSPFERILKVPDAVSLA
jgi:hypothetical protein